MLPFQGQSQLGTWSPMHRPIDVSTLVGDCWPQEHKQQEVCSHCFAFRCPLTPSLLTFQKLLWASCHAVDTPMINFDLHQFAKGGKLAKLENLLRPHLKLHWDDFDVFTKGENVSPR